MNERPIMFSAPMVRAILAGTKTQTRRVMKVQPLDDPYGHGMQWHAGKALEKAGYGAPYLHTSRDAFERIAPDFSPYGQPGDRLWAKEQHRLGARYRNVWCTYKADGYRTTVTAPEMKSYDANRWRPSIHMPRWASRIILEITGVRVERLQEISDRDAEAEGCAPKWPSGVEVCNFQSLWESINGPGSWALNPWVWVLEFKRI